MSSPARPHAASAWLNVTARLGGTVLSFALYLALARLLGPRAFADVAVALAWIAVGSALCSVSLPLALVRFVPEQLSAGRPDLARGVAQFSIALTVALAAATAVVAAVLASTGVVKLRPELVRVALLSAAIVVPSVLLLDFAGLLTALKRALAAELLVNVTRPLLLLVLLGWLWLQSRALLSASTVMAAYLAASLLIVPVCASYCVRGLPTEMSRAPATYDVRGWMRIAGGFMAAALASALYERIDLLVMGWTAPGAEIAAYAVAARFGQTVAVAASAANAVMAPSQAAAKSNADALMIADGGTLLRAIAPSLSFAGLDKDKVKLLGTGLWDDPAIEREDMLVGGWFAAPDPDADAAFGAHYHDVFGAGPPRLASLAYDAVALVALLSGGQPYHRFTQAALMDPNGFNGVDGIFRFMSDGTSERGLAVLEVAPDGFHVVSPAPKTFQQPAS